MSCLLGVPMLCPNLLLGTPFFFEPQSLFALLKLDKYAACAVGTLCIAATMSLPISRVLVVVRCSTALRYAKLL